MGASCKFEALQWDPRYSKNYHLLCSMQNEWLEISDLKDSSSRYLILNPSQPLEKVNNGVSR